MLLKRTVLKSLVFAVMLLFLVSALPALAWQASPAQSGHGRYDAQIQAAITRKLSTNDKFKDVHAGVEDAIITLSGTVKLYRDKMSADRAAHHIEHAQGVRNDITVAPSAISDAQLRDKLADKLRYDRIDQGITFNNFALSVKHGVVTISGQARTPVDKDSALSIVENTPGVTDVVDNIEVLPTSIYDDDLRIRIARAIYGDPALQKYAMDPQAPIRIVVENGRVTLYGVVENAMDKQIAETRARSVSGAFQVTNKLAVASQQAR